MTVKAKTTKPVVTISRNVVKRTGAVVYLCQPTTAGASPYATTVINGKATGCTCDNRAKGFKVCKHMTHCQAKEQARGIVTQAEQNYSSNAHPPLSREAYAGLYDPCYIA